MVAVALTRRQLLAGLAAGPMLLPRALAQGRSSGGAMRVRGTPSVCLYSKVLIKIPYLDLPMILQALGFDGVDFSVEPDGHVPPKKADYNLMPALEAFTGVGLDVPMLTTGLTAPDKDAEQILGLATYIGVPFFRPGRWKFTASPETQMMELPLVQRNVAMLAQFGRATKMVMGIQNAPEGSIGEIDRLIRNFDPQWVGYDFDVAYATREGGDAGFTGPLIMAQSRLKMVTVRDFKWDAQPDSSRKPKPCPLGDGVVDFPKFFAALAKARFYGPISLQVDHQSDGELDAIKHDLAFVRKQIAAAYGG